MNSGSLKVTSEAARGWEGNWCEQDELSPRSQICKELEARALANTLHCKSIFRLML